jgi:hypothetical protein
MPSSYFAWIGAPFGNGRAVGSMNMAKTILKTKQASTDKLVPVPFVAAGEPLQVTQTEALCNKVYTSSMAMKIILS